MGDGLGGGESSTGGRNGMACEAKLTIARAVDKGPCRPGAECQVGAPSTENLTLCHVRCISSFGPDGDACDECGSPLMHRTAWSLFWRGREFLMDALEVITFGFYIEARETSLFYQFKNLTRQLVLQYPPTQLQRQIIYLAA